MIVVAAVKVAMLVSSAKKEINLPADKQHLNIAIKSTAA